MPIASQVELLRSYGPNVPMHITQRLVRAFDELRGLVSEGRLSYPFSVREQVSVVKHLSAAEALEPARPTLAAPGPISVSTRPTRVCEPRSLQAALPSGFGATGTRQYLRF